jgi:hypothetical protein
MLLTGGHFLQYSEYWVMCINPFFILVYVTFTDWYMWCFSNVCVFLFLCSYNVHCSRYDPVSMPVFNTWLKYIELLLLFLVACICTLYLVWAVKVFYLVEATFVAFFCSWVIFCCDLYCVLRSKCYFYFRP